MITKNRKLISSELKKYSLKIGNIKKYLCNIEDWKLVKLINCDNDNLTFLASKIDKEKYFYLKFSNKEDVRFHILLQNADFVNKMEDHFICENDFGEDIYISIYKKYYNNIGEILFPFSPNIFKIIFPQILDIFLEFNKLKIVHNNFNYENFLYEKNNDEIKIFIDNFNNTRTYDENNTVQDYFTREISTFNDYFFNSPFSNKLIEKDKKKFITLEQKYILSFKYNVFQNPLLKIKYFNIIYWEGSTFN